MNFLRTLFATLFAPFLEPRARLQPIPVRSRRR
jgi:hypothetical protein